MTKEATPPLAVAVVVPCSVAVPAPRVAVTTVLLSPLRKLPNWSSILTTGWFAKATPAVAVADGCVWIVSFVAAPALTVTPALTLLVSTAAASVAVIVRVPAVLKVKLDNARVPETKVMFPAVAPLSSTIVALLSELVRVTFGVAVLATFQLASTALTTTALLMAVPAI